jgi:choline dehydrogenase-like flavoprotein
VRLSENPDHRIALLEAGGSERHPFIGIPAGVGAAIMNPKSGWNLCTVPQPALGGANTNASVVAVAEKAADLMRGVAPPAPMRSPAP